MTEFQIGAKRDKTKGVQEVIMAYITFALRRPRRR